MIFSFPDEDFWVTLIIFFLLWIQYIITEQQYFQAIAISGVLCQNAVKAETTEVY